MSAKNHIVVTGGAGYVGSHVVVELLKEGYHVIVIDRLDNSKIEALKQVEVITGKPVQAHNVDITDKESLNLIFQENNVSCVIHLAAKKSHKLSIQSPLNYYKNNVVGLVTLLEVMKNHGVYRMIYASSVAVYGHPNHLPIDEQHTAGDVNDPYSRTKYFCEEVLKDLCIAEEDWSIITLRLFNPVGAHKSGLIGEIMTDNPPNLMPNIAKTALGKQDHFIIYGDKYKTIDGTGERDYTHVVDIAKGHIAALKKIEAINGYKVFNLGTGSPCSALNMVREFEKASGKTIPIAFKEPRSYDTPTSYADISLARKELEWNVGLNITDVCTDAWRWYTNNNQK
ncbi:UDP-glucose 4-epimerase-like [Ruditapes philippinarum]|uniref:UDP-glucose 4-epimerase-like n=1 Tax=Ruditapes philippinarum TaxID=129788 RepID=UPI00295AC282|nr:UDP-glucose 4-epimerase-like [Ruditapes philippinarum]